MKVILLKEVKGRGGEGDVIEVKDGFANNYLLKEGYALKATKGNLAQLEQRRENIAKREEVRLNEANELKAKLDGLKFKVDIQIGDEGQLFGSVTAQMIADGIKKNADVEIDRRRIDLRKAIRTVGLHKAEVVIYRDIKADISVIVGDEDAEKFMESLKNKKNGGKKKEAKKSDNKGEDKDAQDNQVSGEDNNPADSEKPADQTAAQNDESEKTE